MCPAEHYPKWAVCPDETNRSASGRPEKGKNLEQADEKTVTASFGPHSQNPLQEILQARH